VSAVRHRRITEVVLHPRPSVALAAIQWNDVAGRQLRRTWMAHWRQQTVTLTALPASLSPPADPEWNYIVALSTRWYRSSLYFCATYCCPGPNALSPTFEERFARMEFAGAGHFHLAFMRYTGAWIVLSHDLPLDDCLTAIRDDPWFQMA
jgi:hypothetical protein